MPVCLISNLQLTFPMQIHRASYVLGSRQSAKGSWFTSPIYDHAGGMADIIGAVNENTIYTSCIYRATIEQLHFSN